MNTDPNIVDDPDNPDRTGRPLRHEHSGLRTEYRSEIMSDAIGETLPRHNPSLQDAYTIAQQPGEQIKFLVTFKSKWEEAVILYDLQSNTAVAEFNNFKSRILEWTSPVCVGERSQLYAIAGFHKRSPPDGGKPWYRTAFRVLHDTTWSKIIGFDDSREDFDFDDARVEAIINTVAVR